MAETHYLCGTISEFAGKNVPENYLLCDGRAVSRTQYTELFNTIGTTYGSGNGSTTFNLPNFKGKVGVGLDGADTSFNMLGKTGGEKAHTLTKDELPNFGGNIPHTAYGELKLTGDFAMTNGSVTSYEGSANTSSSNKTAYKLNVGANESHNNLQPYLTVNYIIKAIDNIGSGGSDTGWKELVLENNFSKYNNTLAAGAFARKSGDLVNIKLLLKPPALSDTSNLITIATLEKEFCPTSDVFSLCQGSGKNSWLLMIEPTGIISFSRYGITNFVGMTRRRVVSS